MKITLDNITSDSIKLMAKAARKSHKSSAKSIDDDINLMKKIIKWKHFSVLEHASATFNIEGISRACSHQLVRHRHLSFVQESQRYVKLEDDDFFVVPPTISDELVHTVPYKNCILAIKDTYNSLIENGVPIEDARFLLPNATKTTLEATANFRGWREFIDKRNIASAQWEIRKLANMIKNVLMEKTEAFLWN